MKAAALPIPLTTNVRLRFSLHLLGWEIRRLALPLGIWLAAILYPVWFLHTHDWTWPHYSRPDLQEARQVLVSNITVGMALCVAAGVYFVGELFIPLRPGAVRGRFVWPVRRGDALGVSLLILTVLVVVPLVFYYRGWVMARNWYDDDAQFCRQFLPVVPVCTAGLVLAALTAGDWGLYLLTAGVTLLAVFWTESERGPEPLAMAPALLLTVMALAAAVAGQSSLRRWPLYGVWVLGLLLVVRRW